MKKFFFAVSLLILAGCSHGRGVNDPLYPPVMPGTPPDPQHGQAPHDYQAEYHQRAPMAAISGTLYLNGDLPTPLPRVKIILLKKESGSWKELAQFSTEAGGVFNFTRSLPPGDYSLRVEDKRYVGSLPVQLSSGPKQNLVLLAERAKK